MQKISLIVLIFVLVACSAPTQALPTAFVTLTVPPTMTPTSTSTPPPTATPEPSLTPLPQGFEHAPPAALDLIGQEGIANDDTTIYEAATGRVLFKKFGDEFVDTRLGLVLNEESGDKLYSYYQNGKDAFSYLFKEGKIILNDRSVITTNNDNQADANFRKSLFQADNLEWMGNDYFGHLTVYVGNSTNFGIVTHIRFKYNGTDQIVTCLLYRDQIDGRQKAVFVDGLDNVFEDSSEFQLR